MEIVKEANEPPRSLAVVAPGSGPVELRIDESGQLVAREGEAWTKVSLRRCFPWSEPMRFFTLRDDSDREVVLIDNPGDLDASSATALFQALEEARFCFVIVAVRSLKEEFELRRWQVETRQGVRQFQTRLTDWPRALPGGGFAVQDVHGDLYVIPEPAALSARSREALWAFLD